MPHKPATNLCSRIRDLFCLLVARRRTVQIHIREMQPAFAFSHHESWMGDVSLLCRETSVNNILQRLEGGFGRSISISRSLLKANMNALRFRVNLIFSLALPVALVSIAGCGAPTPAISPKTLISVSITPANPSIAVSATEQFTATGNYSDGSTASLSSSVTWASSNLAVATVSEAGMATSVGAGVPATRRVAARQRQCVLWFRRLP